MLKQVLPVTETRERLSSVKKSIMEKAVEYNQRAPKPSKLQITALIALAVPALFLRKYFIAFSLMVAVTLISMASNRFGANKFGIELATFSTVLMATVFPPKIAGLLGFIYIVLQIFSGSTPGVYLTWVVPSYVATGYIISTMQPANIVQTGIQASIALQAVFATMTFIVTRNRIGSFLQYAVFSITFNMLVFGTFGQPLLSLIN